MLLSMPHRPALSAQMPQNITHKTEHKTHVKKSKDEKKCLACKFSSVSVFKVRRVDGRAAVIESHHDTSCVLFMCVCLCFLFVLYGSIFAESCASSV